MALLESCCGCGLAISSAVLGVYLLVAYAIAFAVELWWILESPVMPPIPTYLLCLGYFILFTLSALLLHGLSVKRSTFLLVWLFMMGILLGPEAGLVLYLSIHYWRVTSLYGLIEITCWGCRLLVNAVGLLCVQSLHSIWREEKSVMMRLETLKAQSPVPKLHQSMRGRKTNLPLIMQGVNNHGYEHKEATISDAEKLEIDSYNRLNFSQKDGIFKNEDFDNNYIDTFYESGNEFLSEFNASSFDPTVIDARLEKMPYLTVRKKCKELIESTIDEEDVIEEEIVPKTRSMFDLRGIDISGGNEGSVFPKPQSPSQDFVQKSIESFPKAKNITGSLDRGIIKNKNLKILKTLSPFNRKKTTEDEMNIYQINPPKDEKISRSAIVSNIDSQLNKVYGNRGMYMMDEKTRKVVFYPPEYFNKSGFRQRMDSYNSNCQSRSSMDTTDSEDIRQISDVAL